MQPGVGHYESWFQRANHPTRPLGFWIRYTIFVPADAPGAAQGELWAIYFDGERDSICAAKQELPLAMCRFDPEGLDARIGASLLDYERLVGEVGGGAQTLTWSLRYAGGQAPLLNLPRRSYELGFPKAKVLVGSPNCVYQGELRVNGETIAIDGWVGSQNHNWGPKHTDRYAWAQVCGFDDAPDTFLDVASVQLKVGPLWTPKLTSLVLRVEGREFALNTPLRWLAGRSRYDYRDFRFATSSRDIDIEGRVVAPAKRFVALPYRNPPGGTKTCLNSKIATCELRYRLRGGFDRHLRSEHRSAFEVITDADDHGIDRLQIIEGSGGYGTGVFA